MTTAGDLAPCACVNFGIQSRLSACVQKSCSFSDQVGESHASDYGPGNANKNPGITSFAASLWEAYPKESRVDKLKISAIITISLAFPFLFLRLYARWLKTGRIFLDDGYAIVASVSTRDHGQRTPTYQKSS